MADKRVKEAFSKIKEEMDELRQEISFLRNEIRALTNPEKPQKDSYKRAELSAEVPNYVPNFRERFKNPFLGTSEEENESKLQNTEELSPKEQVSIGNKGVSALRQQVGNASAHLETGEIQKEITGTTSQALQENIERLKHALKSIFKTLTKQEFYVFSLLYQLEDELGRAVSYSDLANRANLTPNSLRDYLSKLIAKKVPIIKEKLNNRVILLKIAPELRNIETLENLMKLVEG